jgi:hypothetical protein
MFPGKHIAINAIIIPADRFGQWQLGAVQPNGMGLMGDADGGATNVFQRELYRLRIMASHGITAAVPAALHFCQKWKQPVPEWLLAESTELLCSLLKGDKPKRLGRASSDIARLRQDGIDYARWSTVVWQREAQQELLEQVEALRTDERDIPIAIREDREKLQAWLGTTLERAFECSTMILEGTSAFGSPDAIKRSYFKVERNSADPREKVRYYQIDPQFLQKLGIEWEPFVRPGRKHEPLYMLSL